MTRNKSKMARPLTFPAETNPPQVPDYMMGLYAEHLEAHCLTRLGVMNPPSLVARPHERIEIPLTPKMKRLKLIRCLTLPWSPQKVQVKMAIYELEVFYTGTHLVTRKKRDACKILVSR